MSNKTAVLTQYDQQRKKYERFAREVEHQLRCILEEEGIVCNAITSRVKERDSLTQKIDVKSDKYKSSVHYVVSMNEDRLKLPENRGYAGIKCEIQIRTVLQHAWAEIEHDLGYKSEIDIPKDIRRSFSRLAGLLEVADKEFQEIRDFLETYREKVEAEISEKTEPEGATLPNTIGVFYLCYAQLILNNYSKERVVQYMENTSIGVLDERDPFVQNLLKYGREFAVQQ